MKKYFIFIISFACIYFGFQILSGLLLTASYTPDSTMVTSTMSQNTVFGNVLFHQPFVLFVIATLAFFLSQKVSRPTNK